MKWWFIAVGLFIVLFVGAVWSVRTRAPWWRVEVRNEIPRVKLLANTVKIAWVLGEFGVWEKSVRGKVPEKVVFVVNANTYDRDKFIDGPSAKVLYSAYDEFVGGDELMISIGLPNIDFFDEPRKMTAILNDRLLRTIMRLVRNKPITSPGSFAIESQIMLQRLPKQVVNTMLLIK